MQLFTWFCGFAVGIFTIHRRAHELAAYLLVNILMRPRLHGMSNLHLNLHLVRALLASRYENL